MRPSELSKKSIWAIVTLVGLYVASQLIADVAATRLVELRGVIMPAGTLIFALTFTVRDLVHKRLGTEWALAAIWTAAGANVLLSFYLLGMAYLPAPDFYDYQDAWSEIFHLVPAITFGSIIAELAGHLTDTYVFAWWRKMVQDRFDWSWVIVSNAAGIPVDSIVFNLAAFVLLPPLFGSEALPIGVALGLSGGQMLYKAIVAILSAPTIYLVQSKYDQPIIERPPTDYDQALIDSKTS